MKQSTLFHAVVLGSHLPYRSFPFAGQRSLTANEGPAYSCMMVMAQGFNRVISNSTNSTAGLETLSAGLMGDALTPETFNTSYVGPVGPMIFDVNGDVMVGNFKIYNIQHGEEVEIGHIIADDLTLTSAPLYHDGTYT
ncbi:hypothetical protein BX666DRAFT_731461 [Dichotomocladium elegans]|nr:hypothetical protein BX666DRAFT_731461 [Dichotomocladium elegans]